jgi:hypothetical protein
VLRVLAVIASLRIVSDIICADILIHDILLPAFFES